MDKRYLALLHGRLPSAAVEVDLPLLVRRADGEARVKVHASGKVAKSSFRSVQSFGSRASLAEVSIATGRTHQIRVHAKQIGHPLAGDQRYGDDDFNSWIQQLGLGRMFLHAHAIAFRWPESDEEFAISVPLPVELNQTLDALDQYRET